jgi:hypothetical protein
MHAMDHRIKVFSRWVIYVVSTSYLFGCLNQPYIQPVKTSAPGLERTLAVQTMVADPNLIKLVFPSSPIPTLPSSPTPTETPPSVEITQALQPSLEIHTSTSTPVLQEISISSPTALPSLTPVPTSTPTCSNSADFVRDITIPDGTRLLPGQYFTKIWLIKNTGTCPWKETYSITNFSGESMGMNSPQLLRRITNPGEFIEVTLDLVAPSAEGTYQGYWILKDENGVSFKSSKDEFFFFWILIDVRKKSLAEKLGFDSSGSNTGSGGCGEYG